MQNFFFLFLHFTILRILLICIMCLFTIGIGCEKQIGIIFDIVPVLFFARGKKKVSQKRFRLFGIVFLFNSILFLAEMLTSSIHFALHLTKRDLIESLLKLIQQLYWQMQNKNQNPPTINERSVLISNLNKFSGHASFIDFTCRYGFYDLVSLLILYINRSLAHRFV